MDSPSATAKTVFLEALEIASAQERQELLAARCGGNVELRSAVEELLRHHEQINGFLETPPTAVANLADTSREQQTTADRLASIQVGTQIGAYQLLQVIGEGGMGTVWMAQQTQPVKRLVAVKLIKAGMDSRQVITRFEAERQALAIMDHANIARVLDAGTTSGGRPYFVMDLVRGLPITKYCDENHLTQRQRLELMVPVCQAIQHAHQKGIIHRDLKPSNVLVAVNDGQPVPKVIDFGVAKAAGQPLTEQTLVTGLGHIVGTLEYMSPEQAEINQLDIDTRSDIYSLGVLLYELLTGSPPFSRQELEKAGMLEMLRIIREEEPSKPSTRLSTADGLPTLAANRGTEPARLTKLVRGELDWIVMKALEKDRSRRYETAAGIAADLRRYLNDDPVQAGPPSAWYRLRKFARRNKGILATAAVVGLALLVCVSAIGWTVRDRIARQAEAQRLQAARKDRVSQQIQLILEQVSRLEGEQKWPEALEAAQRASDLVASGETDAEAVRRVKDTIDDLELVRLLDDIRASRSETSSERGFNYRVTAERYAAAFEGAGIDLTRLAPEEGAQRFRSRSAVIAALLPALDDWAICYQTAGNERQADSVWNVAGLVDSDTLRQQVRQALRSKDDSALQALVESPDLGRQSAATLNLLEVALRERGRLDAALGVLSVAQRNYPTDFWIHFGMAHVLENETPPNSEQAAAYYRAALAVRPRSAAAWNNLGASLKKLDRLDDAAACYERSIELDPKFFMAHANLGLIWQTQGKLDEAIACYRRAVELDSKSPIVHSNLGSALNRQGKTDDAVVWFKKAIEIAPNLAVAHFNLAAALTAQNKLDEAIACYRKATELNPKFVLAYQRLAAILLSQKRDYEGAAEVIQKVISLQPELPQPHLNLGVALKYVGKEREAIASHRKALQLQPNFVDACTSLARLLTTCTDLQLRNSEEALQLARRAVELAPKSAEAWASLGWAQHRSGNWPASVEALEESIALEASIEERKVPQWFCMAMANWQLGDQEAARKWYSQAAEWADKNQPNNQELRRLRVEVEALMKDD